MHSQSNKYEIDLKDYEQFTVHGSIQSRNSVFFIKKKNNNEEKYVSKTSQYEFGIDDIKYFRRELQILIFIQHPTIIQLKGFSYKDIEGNNKITIITKYMPKGSLEKLIKSLQGHNPPTDFDNTKRQIILVGIAFGMMLFHYYHIIHRDLKPANVLLEEDYSPRISDFDASRFFEITFSINQTLGAIGTLYYMAPELYFRRPYDTSVDVYSFSILLTEFLNEKRPYYEDKELKLPNIPEFFEKVDKSKRPRIDNNVKISYPGFVQMIEAGWSADPNLRPTFNELFRKLSLLPEEKLQSYEQKYPFLKRDKPDILKDDKDLAYQFKDVDKEELYSYIDDLLLNSVKPFQDYEIEPKFLRTIDICKKIFSLRLKNAVTKEELTGKHVFFLKKLLFLFPSDIENNSSDISISSFKSIMRFFVFEGFNDNLIEICDKKELFQNAGSLKIITFYAFFAWISISISIFKQEEVDITVLLTVLNKIIRIQSIYRDIAISCFLDVIFLGTEKDAISNFEKIFKEMLVLFVNNTVNLPNHSNEVLLSISRKIIQEKEELNDESIGFIKLISSILVHNPKVIQEKTACAILDTVKRFIFKFEENCLILLLNFVQFSQNIRFKLFIETFFIKQIINSIILFSNNDNSNDDDELSESNDQNKVIKKLHSKSSKLYQPPIDLYQTNKTDGDEFPISLKSQKLTDLFDEKLFSSLSILEKIILKDIEFSEISLLELANKLQNLEKPTSIKAFYKKYLIVFYLTSEIINKYPKITIKSKIDCSSFIKLLFDPSFTYLNQNSYFEEIYYLRKTFLQLALIKNAQTFSEILEMASNYPQIILEILNYFPTIQNDIVCEELIAILARYRIDSDTSKLTKDESIILNIRKKIILILIDNPLFEYSFKTRDSINYYCTLLMEPLIRIQIINSLLGYLSSNKTPNNYLFKSLLRLFKIYCHKKMPFKEQMKLFISIIGTLNDAILSNKSLCYEFKSMMPTIFQYVMCISTKDYKEEELSNLLIYLIYFWHNIYQIQTIDVSIIELLIEHFIKKINKAKIIQKFIQLLSCDEVLVIDRKPNFEIKNSIFICSLVRIFLSTNQIGNVLAFLSDLCSYSKNNCIICHECGLDSLILNIITNWRNKTVLLKPIDNDKSYSFVSFEDEDKVFITETKNGLEISEYIINLLLHLFSQISLTVSSIPIINNFFSLLCPYRYNDSSCISILNKNIINALIEILYKSRFIPYASLKIPSFPVLISSIPANLIKDGFTIVFWFYRSALNDQLFSNILKIKQQNKLQFLEISIFGDNLHVIIKSNSRIKDSQFKIEIPYNKWTMISITLKPNLDKTGHSIISVYNNKQIESKETEISFSPNNLIDCIFNQSDYNPNAKDLDSDLLGNFLLSKALSNEEIETIEAIGQKSSYRFCDNNNKIIFAYEIQHSNNENLCFKNLIKNNNIKIQYTETPYHKLYSFSDIILYNNNLNLIIPIFLQSDNMLVDATNSIQINNAATEILSNIFLLGDDVQRLFFESNYFYAISHCLKSVPAMYITYDLYLHYFNLLDKISNYELEVRFIDAILLDYDLWSRSDENNQKDIFNHWKESLCIQYKDSIASIRPYEWFLFNIQNNKTHPICRKTLFSISLGIFNQNPSSELILLTILMMNSSSLNLANEILDHLHSIFMNEVIINSLMINFSEILNCLINIIEHNNDEEIIYRIIVQIVSIYKTYRTKMQDCRIESLHNLITVLISKEEFTFSKDVFSNLILFMNNNNSIELLPILCINVIKGGSDYLPLLKSGKFNTGIDYYIDNEFTIYSSLLIFKFFSNKNFYLDLIRLNISIYRQHLSEFINSIYAIGILGFTPSNLDKIKHDVFDELLSKLSNKQVSQQKINSLIEVVYMIGNFIFFRTELQPLISIMQNNNNNNNDISNQIKHLESLFLSFISFDDDSIEHSKILINLNSLFIKMNGYLANQKSRKMPDYKIEIRIEKDKWLDLDLAEKFFFFYSVKEVSQLKEFIANLSSCISKYDRNFVTNNKPKLKYTLNFTEKKFDIKMIGHKDCQKYNEIFSQVFNILEAIARSFNSQNSYNFQGIKEKYENNFKDNQKEIIDINQSIFDNILNCLTINRSAWCKLNSLNQKSIIKRIDMFNNNCYYPSNVYKKHMNKNVNSNRFMNENKKLKCIECRLNKIKSVRQAFIQVNKDMISIFYDGITKIVHSKELSFANYTIMNEQIFKLIIIVKTGEYFDLDINRLHLSKITEFISIEKIENLNSIKLITELWKDNKISNFEYLLKLNLLSGRSFNDAKHYPIFPLIFADYESSNYRNLSHKMNTLPNDFLVYYWLFRIEPFTSKHQKSSNPSIFGSINEMPASELIPEFFFLPEFLKSKKYGDVVLPSWSKQSPNEFIYRHRKALESEYFSMYLNKWIDSIWGIHNNQVIPKLFEQAHQKRNKFVPKKSSSSLNEYSFIKFNGISDIVCFDVALKESFLYFTLIDSHGEVCFYSVDVSCLEDKKQFTCHSVEKITTNENMLSPKFIDPQHFCFIDKSNNKDAVQVFNVSNRNIEKTIEKNCKIISIGTDSEGLLAISTEDTSISIYVVDLIPLLRNTSKSFIFSLFQSNNQNLEYMEKIFAFKGVVDCIAINSIFHICVCGTTDNCLLLCQINKNKIKINRVIKTVKKPQKVIITDNFGFIVVLFQNEIALYNINGERIRSLKIDAVAITKASSQPGKFDYLIVADKNNRISVLEAFYMKIGKHIFECESKIQEITYIKEESLIIAFREDSTASVIYYPIVDYESNS